MRAVLWRAVGAKPVMRLILASASPRRRDLLAQIGVVPDTVTPTEIDETPVKGELPRAYVMRMAVEKGRAITSADLIVSADTVVSCGRRILGKPKDAGEAARFLLLLSGRRHRVTTSVCLRRGDVLRQKTVETKVRMKRLSDAEISAYLRSGEWRGKAGGYAIQGIGAGLIPEINGSYTNVVGLPLVETAGLLTGMGYDVTYDGVPA